MATPAHDTHADSIRPVERALADRDGERDSERFARAGDISARFLDNIETVVYGKRDEIAVYLRSRGAEL